jgi:hypothetical protein
MCECRETKGPQPDQTVFIGSACSYSSAGRLSDRVDPGVKILHSMNFEKKRRVL